MSNHEPRMVTIHKGNGQPMRAQKQDRNAKCKCGSGKKAKNCCGCATEYYFKDVKPRREYTK